ncbi:hypothetical protein U0070_000715, partial [Myodes glareolus]
MGLEDIPVKTGCAEPNAKQGIAQGTGIVAVYLKDSWWSIEDVLRTSDPTREGLMKACGVGERSSSRKVGAWDGDGEGGSSERLLRVQSFGERIVLFVLNTIVFGRLERSLDADDMFFLPHPAKEQAKILWRDGAAVGFYSVKMKGTGFTSLSSVITWDDSHVNADIGYSTDVQGGIGEGTTSGLSSSSSSSSSSSCSCSLCGDGTGACYLLPVFDTVFVRRKHRSQGLGTAMLRDFCDTFREDEALGISCPISPAMYKVLRRFLSIHPGERGRLWEVEPPGDWGQRTNIWLKVCLQEARPQD